MNEEKLAIIAIALALIFAVGMVTIEPVEGFISQLGIGKDIKQQIEQEASQLGIE